MTYGTEHFYRELKRSLVDWVWNNPRLLRKITKRNLEHLFEFDPQLGLSIDLRRFEPEYYKATFYPPEEKKQLIDAFVAKVCMVIRHSLKAAERKDLTITITVRHMISDVSHWRTFFISEHYDVKKPASLTKKDTDWHYRFPQEEINLTDC